MNTPALFADEHFGFREGLRAPFQGVAFLIGRPKFLAMCVTPWILNLTIILPLVWMLMAWVVYPWLAGMLPDFQTAWLNWSEYVMRFLIIVILIAAGGALFLLGAIILGAPIHDFMGERMERELLAERPDLQAPSLSIMTGAKHAILEALRRVAITLPFVLLAFLLGLIPVIGPALVAAANLYIAALFLTLDAFAMPMDRRGIPMKEKREWMGANHRFALGFGLPMLAIPVAFIFMPPLAAVSGTLMYCRYLLETGGPVEEKENK